MAGMGFSVLRPSRIYLWCRATSSPTHKREASSRLAQLTLGQTVKESTHKGIFSRGDPHMIKTVLKTCEQSPYRAEM
eukprot:4380904-Amphidinium_carterae.1